MGFCAAFAYSQSETGAGVARVVLLPTWVADIAINGVHASGGVFSQVVAIAVSVLVYGCVLWIGFEVFDRKRKQNQSPDTTRGT